MPEDEAAALRKDYTASPNDNVIIHAMEGSPSALGFVGFAFAEEAGDAVKEIQVDGGSGCVSPIGRDDRGRLVPALAVALHLREQRGRRATEVAAYVDFYLTDEAVATGGLVEDVGYIALPAERIEASRSAWQSATA